MSLPQSDELRPQSHRSPSRRPSSRQWQFSLFTLLVAMTCVGLACVALVSPSELSKGLVFVLAAGSLLVAGLCIVYRDGRSRAFAVGFVIFGTAYFLVSLGDTPDVAEAHTTLPTTRWGIALYTLVHGESVRPMPAQWPAFPVAYSAGVPVYTPPPASITIEPVTMMAPPPATSGPVPADAAAADPAAAVGPAESAAGIGPADPAVVAGPAPSPPVLLPTPVYSTISLGGIKTPSVVPLSSFLSVVHNLLVLALGVLGGITAQILHSTRRDPTSAPTSA